MDINTRLAEIRTEADKFYKAAENLKKDAAQLYARADRIWTAKIIGEQIRREFLAVKYSDPDTINGVIDHCLESVTSEGLGVE